VPLPNLTDAEVYRPIKAAFAPLLAAAPPQARRACALCCRCVSLERLGRTRFPSLFLKLQ